MEIQYEGAHRKSGSYTLVKETPINARVGAENCMILEIRSVGIDLRNGKYDIRVSLTPTDIGKIVAEFYNQALKKDV